MWRTKESIRSVLNWNLFTAGIFCPDLLEKFFMQDESFMDELILEAQVSETNAFFLLSNFYKFVLNVKIVLSNRKQIVC